MKNPVTLTKIENDVASCNVCYARNYDADRGIGSRVDTLYYLKVASQGVTLCDACRKHVAAVLTSTPPTAKTLSEYLTDITKIDKPLQVINGNYDVLYYGVRDEAKIPYDCKTLIVVKEEPILDVADCVVVEYDT